MTADVEAVAALPPFDGAPFLASAAWWRCVCGAALPPGARPEFLVLAGDGAPYCVVPLLRPADGTLCAFDTPYTMFWRPALAPDSGPALLAAAGEALGRACRAPVLRLDALEPEWPGHGPFLAGLRRSGRVLLRFQHFGNWVEELAGRPWEAYLAGRPGPLRETIRRKQARMARTPALRLAMARTVAEAAAFLPAYQDVYRRSWKQPEPFPAFDARLLEAAAVAGVLRLGLLWLGGTPIAAQYWVVDGGTATVLKLAHDEQHKALSPGTLLTAWMIRHMIEAEGVAALDFGRGDDPYKQHWAGQRRQRIGVLAADPWRLRGLAAIGRQWGGRIVRITRKRPPQSIHPASPAHPSG